jgi:hypothetical protein
MEKTKPSYELEYLKFLDSYTKGQLDGEDLGMLIVKLAHHFSEYNNQVCQCEQYLTIVARDIEVRVDDDTGKVISSAKAKVLVAATKEASDLLKAKTHLENIEQYINALKSLQKGIMNEYSYMSRS